MQKERKPKLPRGKVLELSILAVMLFLFAFFSVKAFQLTDPLTDSSFAGTFLLLTVLLFSVLLYFFCINSFCWNYREKQIFKWLIVILFLCALIQIIGNIYLYNYPMLIDTILYLLTAVYWLAFWMFQKGKYSHPFNVKHSETFFFVFFGIFSVSVLVNYFTGFCFSYGPDGSFEMRFPLIFYMTFLWFIFYFIIALTSRCRVKTKLTLASYSAVPLLIWLLIIPFHDSSFYMEIFSSLASFFYLIQLYLLFFNIYLENGRLFLQREKELEESRANALMLKISPHFISNTMSSIVALCYSDAEQAGDLAAKFARYLRDNYTYMNESPMIPFSKELEHIKNYLAVEQVRFPNVKVEYDIREERFLLPTLTVQPLVENAVRHGISKRHDASGRVLIRTFDTETDHVIRIEDDGVGICASAEADEKKHVGISNARKRLAMLCAGTLSITSQPQQGTVCEIHIPKGEKK